MKKTQVLWELFQKNDRTSVGLSEHQFALWSRCSLTHSTDLLIPDHLYFLVAVTWNKGTKSRLFRGRKKKGNLKGLKTSWQVGYCLRNMIVIHRNADTDIRRHSQATKFYQDTFLEKLTWKVSGKIRTDLKKQISRQRRTCFYLI